MSLSNAKEEVRRRRAFEDFYDLPIKDRSVNKLYNIYTQRADQHPENIGDLPTRDRNVLYRWAKEDDWGQKALERQDQEFERVHGYLHSVQKRAYSGLAAIVDDAVGVLYDKMLNSTNDKVATDTAWRILEILNVNQAVSLKAENREALEPKEDTQINETPSFVFNDDATEEDYLRILSEAVENRA